MQLGVFSNVIDGTSPEEVAEKTARYGLHAVQFIPAASGIGFGFDRPGLGDDYSRWGKAYAEARVTVAAIGGYINLVSPFPEVRKQNLDTFKGFMREARALGTRHISTETGTYAKSGDWDDDPLNHTPFAWDELRRVTEDLLVVAEQEDVVILYEPYIVNIAHTPALGVRIVKEMASPHLRLLMDPTNWFEQDLLHDMTTVIESGFAVERGLFDLAHAKDVARPTDDSGKPALPAAGEGLLDYATYVRLLREHGYDGPLILEHLVEAQVPQAMRYVQQFLDRDERS